MPKNILRSACFKRSSCHRCGVSRNNSVWKEGSRDLPKHPWYPCPNGILVLLDSPMMLGSQTWSDKVGVELDWQQMAKIYHGIWHTYSPKTHLTMEHHRFFNKKCIFIHVCFSIAMLVCFWLNPMAFKPQLMWIPTDRPKQSTEVWWWDRMWLFDVIDVVCILHWLDFVRIKQCKKAPNRSK